MALSFASNSLHLANWGFSLGDLAIISGAGRAVITWMTAAQRDSGLLEFLNTVPSELGIRKGLVSPDNLNRRWGRELSLLRNGRRSDYSLQNPKDTMDNFDRFTWLMTILVTCLDQAVSSAALTAIITEVSMNIFSDKVLEMDYLQFEIPQHIEGWRSIGCVRKMSLRASGIWQRLERDGRHLPGFVPESDCDELIRMLVWLTIGTTPEYVTSSGDAFSLAMLLQEMGLELLRTGTLEDHFDESTIAVRLDTNAFLSSKDSAIKERSGMRIPLLALDEIISLWPGTVEQNNRRREVFMLGKRAASGIDFATRGVESADDLADPSRWILAFSIDQRPSKRVSAEVFSFARRYLFLPTQAAFDVLSELIETWYSYHHAGSEIVETVLFNNMPPDMLSYEHVQQNGAPLRAGRNGSDARSTWHTLGEIQIFLLGYYYTALSTIVDCSQLVVKEAYGSWSWYDAELVKEMQRFIKGGQDYAGERHGKGKEYKREDMMTLIGRLYAGTGDEQATFVRPETAGIISKLTVLTPALLGDADHPDRIRKFVLLDVDSTSIPCNGAKIVNAVNPIARLDSARLVSAAALEKLLATTDERDPDFTSHIEPAWGYDATLCTVTYRYKGRLVHKANPLRSETLILKYWASCSKFNYSTGDTAFMTGHNCSSACTAKDPVTERLEHVQKGAFQELGDDWQDTYCYKTSFIEYCNREFTDPSIAVVLEDDKPMEELREAIQMSQLNMTKSSIHWVPTEGKKKARACLASMYPGNTIANFTDSVKQFRWTRFSSIPIVVQQRDRALLVFL
ncbi:hypothetical protein AA0118_g5388 [Alternaria tenuissima]|nr:hypothetical protein AA0118_g5388 [Alternaria tenuissima]RYN87759.1 hypothetical protein AA0120_g7420 [Alternaria tenuissima]